jgi:ABC-type multidrug transport system permease subunit
MTAFVIKLSIAIAISIIVGGIYSNIGYSQLSIQNRSGVLFLILISQGFQSLLAVLNSFPSEKRIVRRERSGRAYTTISYFCAKVAVELPLNLVLTIFYSCICYLYE